MGKSLRSKVKKRWRSLKRQHIEDVKVRADTQDLSNKLLATIQNKSYRVAEPLNAFLHPGNSDAKFPQYKAPQMIDFRSSSIPMSGAQYSGSKRVKKNVKTAQVKTIIVKDDVIEQEQPNQQQDDGQDDLASAMGNMGVKSKNEKKKSNQQRAMGDETQIKQKIDKKKKLSKRARTEQGQTRKSKRIVNF